MTESKRNRLQNSSKSVSRKDIPPQDTNTSSDPSFETSVQTSSSEVGVARLFLGFPLFGVALFLLWINHGAMKTLLLHSFGRILFSFKNESIELAIATTIGTLGVPYLMLFAATFSFWALWRLWDAQIPRPGRSRFNYFDVLIIFVSPILLGMILTLKYMFIG
jgi:hypothetical protein